MMEWSQYVMEWPQYVTKWPQYVTGWPQYVMECSQYVMEWSQYVTEWPQYVTEWPQYVDGESKTKYLNKTYTGKFVNENVSDLPLDQTLPPILVLNCIFFQLNVIVRVSFH